MDRLRSADSTPLQSPLLLPAEARRRLSLRSTRTLIGALLLTVLLPMLFVAWALPAYGAVVLEYFNAIPSSSAVLLEWSTASEYNVAGFEVQCKNATEPDSAYHRIGFFNAKGNATQGAQYDMLVTQLQPGVPYCFRLKEITTDNEPGESRDRCGYGLSLTPTPTSPFVPGAATGVTTLTVGITPTVVLFPAPTLQPGLLPPTPTLDPFAPAPTWTPTYDPFLSPLATPTLDPFAPIPTATLDPFAPTPTPTVDYAPGQITPTPLGASGFDAAAAAPEGMALMADPALAAQQITPDPNLFPPTATLDPYLAQPQSPLEAPTATPMPEPTATPTASTLITGTLQGDSGASMAAAAAPPETLPATAGAQPTPTALYVVVTAAPTPAGQGIPPMVTPWPTATPAAPLLASLMVPTAQNLTVMLLCFIFISASGLGVLGLVTSIIYMRSRPQRDLDELRLRYRRRV